MLMNNIDCMWMPDTTRSSTDKENQSKERSLRIIAGNLATTIFQVCCRGNCEYVAKFTPNMYADETEFMRLVENEVNIQHALSKYNIAPHIHYAAVCPHEFLIIMDKLDVIFQDQLSNNLFYWKMAKQDGNTENMQKYSTRIYALIEQALILLDHLHHYGYTHNDLHFKNIMLNVDSHNEPIISSMRIIDYGNARVDPSKTAHKKEFDDFFKRIQRLATGYGFHIELE